jgi:hypothetical protein
METSGQLHAPAALLPGKEPRYPLNRRLGGHQGRCGRFGKHLLPLTQLLVFDKRKKKVSVVSTFTFALGFTMTASKSVHTLYRVSQKCLHTTDESVKYRVSSARSAILYNIECQVTAAPFCTISSVKWPQRHSVQYRVSSDGSAILYNKYRSYVNSH